MGLSIGDLASITCQYHYSHNLFQRPIAFGVSASNNIDMRVPPQYSSYQPVPRSPRNKTIPASHAHHIKSSSSNPSSLLLFSSSSSNSSYPLSFLSFSSLLSLTTFSSSFFFLSASRLFSARCWARYASLAAGNSSAERIVRVFSRRLMVALRRVGTSVFFVYTGVCVSAL